MDAKEFRRASQAVWDAMAPGWDDRHAYFEETARPVTEAMLARLDPRPGQTILDLAAGTGVVGFATAAIVGPTGHVIMGDFAEAMVDAARRQAAATGVDNVESRVLDAEQIDLPDDVVDGVACRWGYMLMADPATALAETRRVLRDGGRLCCAVFAGPEDNPWAALPMQVLVERGHVAPPEPGAPGILALADRDRFRRLITDAGFRDPQLEDVAIIWRFSDDDDFWRFLNDAAGAIAMVLARLDDEERRRVREAISVAVEPFGTPNGIEIPSLAIVASAT
jgi:ubiquinone/menaquinone biosynthesis C-methylase UbiE